jgi:hypothetical protein
MGTVKVEGMGVVEELDAIVMKKARSLNVDV